MADIIILKNKSGDNVYPVTSSDSIKVGNNKILTQKLLEQQKEIDQTKEVLLQKTSIVQENSISEEYKYIKSNGDIGTTSTSLYIYFYEVEEGKTYCVRNTNHTGTYAKYAIYSSITQIDNTTCLFISNGVNLILEDDSYVTIPSEGKLLAVVKHKDDISVSGCDYINVKDDISELQDSVGYIINESDITFVDGKYVSINKNIGDYFGGVLSNAGGKLATIDLDQQFESITFTTVGGSAITKHYAIVDDNGIILQLADTFRKATTTLYKRDLPEKSKTLYINYWTSTELPVPSGTIRVNNIDSAIKDTEILKKKLYGKRIICFGDSITEGVGNSYVSWVDYLEEYFGATVTKMGVGGSHLTPAPGQSQNGLFVYKLIEAWYTKNYTDMDASIEWAHSTDYGTRWDHVQYNIKNTSPTDYDVVIIAAGTNDWNSTSLSLGEWSDTDPAWNITASLKGIIRMLHEMNPNLYILVVPPVPRYIKRDGESGSNKDVWDESTNFSDNYKDITQVKYYLWEVSEKMNEVAKKCHTQSIESYWSGFGFNWDAWKLCTSDGTHLNAIGYKTMAEKIGNYLASNYCRH